MDIDLAKLTIQCLILQNYKMFWIDRLEQHYPYVPMNQVLTNLQQHCPYVPVNQVKDREREERK